ncbi:hypothetical protein [Kosakonia sacchari]|uniref:hypothetical protein n=1 Tax=Kosakonia sacchari TaxID=1158459 RepID=UPI001585146F|nr:hypothetical protein [Kosakonia sacchari]NUL35095.1 hypothetical protein [Kosakonia sacchari]
MKMIHKKNINFFKFFSLLTAAFALIFFAGGFTWGSFSTGCLAALYSCIALVALAVANHD